ncbi:hypothetical protein OC846_002021 [Tilletia horrida]|uniref:Uncharacterized protein n=1 Tax=Tilletia horrida TaxID=155126 RepID=A0AAN6JSJ5_9BASI|nr:hypothetical protein OC845_002162 [Tilletia horrida]KAK0554687.1 hypothetical protein OC846_002021 [Tilletia horrida]KAK0569809.1 hypothetical protein OC861_000520 [Tilletia horrida]
MGSCLSSSKIDTRTAGQGQRLGDATNTANRGSTSTGAARTPSTNARPNQTSTFSSLGASKRARDASTTEDREQRARAAEERAKALANRGGGTGKLSRKLEEQNRRTNAGDDGRGEGIPERVVWD